MKVLLRRSIREVRAGTAVGFVLWVKFDLTEAEADLLRHPLFLGFSLPQRLLLALP